MRMMAADSPTLCLALSLWDPEQGISWVSSVKHGYSFCPPHRHVLRPVSREHRFSSALFPESP